MHARARKYLTVPFTKKNQYSYKELRNIFFHFQIFNKINLNKCSALIRPSKIHFFRSILRNHHGLITEN